MTKLDYILAAILIILLSGCGGRTDSSTGTNANNRGSTDETSDLPPPRPAGPPPTSHAANLFRNSVASNDIDFIHSDDQDEFESLAFAERGARELPDSRSQISSLIIDQNTYVFEATFSNGKIVEIWASSVFTSQEEATNYAQKVTGPLGKLPQFMRDTLSHVVIHKGDEGAFAESIANFFVLYSDNMDTRISNNDLEETVFHETVHATLDDMYLNSTIWLNAQSQDNGFVTLYAQENFNKEDMAESALFAYTFFNNPARLPDNVKDWLETNNTNRLAFLEPYFKSELNINLNQ